MSAFSITNISEMRSILSFSRISNNISDILTRLETGQRINSSRDDPSGITLQARLRADIKGIQTALQTTQRSNDFLSTAESGLASISQILIGDINTDDSGLIGLIYDSTLSSDMKQQQINDILSMIDSIVRGTTYNGKRMLDGSMTEGALFQLGKDVQTSMQYRMDMPSMTTSHLGGESGTLYELRTIDLDTTEGQAQAYAIINEAVNMVAKQRGTIGAVQKNVLNTNSSSLDSQLEQVTESEALLSNADMAWESSRLNRAELLAQSAMNSILYSRSFGQFMISLLL